MEKLDPSALREFVNSGKQLEQYISDITVKSIQGFRWISIVLHRTHYYLFVHDVVDERSKVESIYQFRYFEPDFPFGKELIRSEDFESVLKLADELGARREKYILHGNLDLTLS